MFFRFCILMLLIACICNSASALDSCLGKRVFNCSSLPSNVAAKKKCYLYYRCKELPTGEACFQCRSSLNPLTKGLCEQNSKKECLKKET